MVVRDQKLNPASTVSPWHPPVTAKRYSSFLIPYRKINAQFQRNLQTLLKLSPKFLSYTFSLSFIGRIWFGSGDAISPIIGRGSDARDGRERITRLY